MVVSKISFITFGNRGQFSTHFLRMHQIDSVTLTRAQEYYEYYFSTTIIHAKLSKKCNLCSDLVQLMSRVKIMLFTWIRKIFMTLHFISSSFYLPAMFQALIFQERDARGDLKAHRQVQSPPATPPMSPKMEVNIVKHPTRANLIGGKGLFVDMHTKQ